MLDIEIIDSDELVEDLQANEIHETSPSKKFFLSNLSKKGLQKIWSKIIYSGKKGSKRLNNKIENLSEELINNKMTIDKLNENLKTSSKLQEIDEKISKIEKSDLDEEDKNILLSEKYGEKQEYVDGLKEEISKLNEREEKGQNLLNYYKNVQSEMNESKNKMFDKKSKETSDIKLPENDVVNNIIKSEMKKTEEQAASVIKADNESVSVNIPKFNFDVPMPDSGLEEHYNNLMSSIQDLVKFAEAYKNASIEVYNSDLSRVQEAYRADAKRMQDTYDKEKNEIMNKCKKEISKLNDIMTKNSEQYKIDLGIKDTEIKELQSNNSKLDNRINELSSELNIEKNNIIKRDETISGLQLEINSQKMEIDALNYDKVKLKDDNVRLREQNEYYEQQWENFKPLIQAMNQVGQMNISTESEKDKIK